AANAVGEERFGIAIVSRRNVRQERECGAAVVAREIRFGESEIWIWPGGLQARSFAQFAEARLVFIGQQAADIVLESVETQRTLALGELRERGAVRFVALGKQAPDNLGLDLHQRIERTAFADGRKQRQRIGAEDA